MKRIFVIATGGTIAGVGEAGGQRYRSGELGVGALLESVPALGGQVEIRTHQLANIGSQDMSEAIWLELAALVAQKLESADCDGVVIIHGTDTLEETAFFLHCVLPQTPKPVVLTGAMRPATALAPDGPRNLFAAIAVAASDASAGRGALVVFADQIFAAANVFKTHTQSLSAFSAVERGALGRVSGADVVYDAPAVATEGVLKVSFAAQQLPAPADHSLALASLAGSPQETLLVGSPQETLLLGGAVPHAGQPVSLPRIDLAALAGQGTLPKVAIVTAYVGQLPEQITALVQLGYRGIVYAGLGNGNFSAAMLGALKAARAQGVCIVRASRVPLGGVTACGEVDDAAHGFICGGALNPQQARILLGLALAHESDPQQIRRWFACDA